VTDLLLCLCRGHFNAILTRREADNKGVRKLKDSIIVAVLLVTCQLVTFVALACLIRLWASRKQAEVEARITDELARLVAGTPCQSASVLNAVGKCVGQEAGRSAKMAILGELSGAQRGVNAIAQDAAIEGIGQSQPALGAILAGMGKSKAKGLLNNPLVQMALAGMQSKQNGDKSTMSGDAYQGRRHRD